MGEANTKHRIISLPACDALTVHLYLRLSWEHQGQQQQSGQKGWDGLHLASAAGWTQTSEFPQAFISGSSE